MKTIVLCVDRDDDFGRSTGIRGPIIGIERNTEAAKRLGLRDPEDTDVNALFAAVKTAKELHTEVVTITGDKNRGLLADKKIAQQLDKVMDKLKPDSVILISDGIDDEQVIPVIQSRVKIDAVNRVTVRQSKELEKAYFKLAHFLKEVTEEPNLARLLFGVPGIALILLAIGGIHALNMIIGLIGGYLILKGFGWEEEFFDHVTGFIRTLSIDRISTFIYVISFMTLIISLPFAYGDLQEYPINIGNPKSALNAIALLMVNSKSISYFILAIIIGVTARTVDEWSRKNFIQVSRYLRLAGFIVLVNFIMKSGAQFILMEQYVFGNFFLTSVMGIALFYLWTKITELWFNNEIELIKDIIKEIKGLTVMNTDGDEIGKVSKAFVEDLQLKAIKVGRKYYGTDDFEKSDKIVLLK